MEGAFLLLETLARMPGAGLSSLAVASGLPKATVHRLLDQLSVLGMVERQEGSYQVGYRAFELGQSWQPCPGLHAALRRPARELARASGASVAVCVVRGSRTLIMAYVQGERGPAGPLDTTYPWTMAAGKVIVAFHCAEAPSMQEAPTGWRREAAVIRERGVAMSDGEVAPGIRCLAVPIHGAGGKVVAALAAMLALSAYTAALVPGLRRAAKSISATLRAESAVIRSRAVR